MSNFILNVLKLSTLELFYLTGIVIIIGLILGFLEKQTNNNMQRAFGYKGVLSTAIIGTPIHELGHAIMCIIFFHKINEIKLINFHSNDGTLGYVRHSYNKSNLYERIGNFFIGIGPIISGALVLLLFLNFLLPNTYSYFYKSILNHFNYTNIDLNMLKYVFGSSLALLKYIFSINNLITLKFWFFVIIAFCVSAHIALSPADIKGALDGFIVLYLILILINSVACYFSINTFDFIIKIASYNTYFSSLLLLALTFSIISFLISLLFVIIKKSIKF